EQARPGQTVALLTLSDGADAVILKTTAALGEHRVPRTVAAQVGAGGPIPYGKFLSWRGVLTVEPPRRPEPTRTSSSAAGRNLDYKFAFVGSEADDGTIRLPPSPNDTIRHPMAATAGTIVTYIVDYWLGTASSGSSGLGLSKPLELEGKPVTRVENFCATGSDALRQSAYAVASGAYDVAMTVGVEKVKDSGLQGLTGIQPPNDGTVRTLTAAAMYSMIVPAYAKKFGVDKDELKTVLARIASKNHYNGARNPRAQFQREMSVEQLVALPNVAGDLSVFDCSGVGDGAAAAIVCRAEGAQRYTDKPLYIKALSFVAGNGKGLTDPA